MKSILKFLFAAALVLTAAAVIGNSADLVMQVAVVAFTIAALTLVVPARFTHVNEMYAVTPVKVWQTYIIEKLRRSNDWLFRSSDASAKVLGGSTVYIPQAGSDPTVEVNSTSYPGTPAARTDSDVNYALDIFRTVPHYVPWAELQDISYEKMDSVLGAHYNTLMEAIGDKMLINWAATVAGKQVRTTGSDVAGVGNQAGTRKGLSHKDLQSVMIAMNVANVPKTGRVAVIDDNMYEYFYDEMSDKQWNAYNQFANNQTGQVGRLHSFDIYTRSAVLNYATAGTSPNAYAATQLATDNLACLCWHADFVERAQGEIKRFLDKDDPQYYGDITSAIVKFGGRKKREDNNGVISIIQQ